MENMKTNMLMIPLLAAVALFLVSFASAANLATNVETTFNELDLGSITVAGMVGEVVPVRVSFEATTDMDDVKVKVRMEGHRDDVSASTSRFDIVSGTTYTKLLSLKLPTDSDELIEEYTLYVEIISSSDRTEEEYVVRLQRESYTLEILSVDYSSQVSAGDVIPVSVVVKNNGFNDADDAYVVASIPALGVTSRGYVGDLVAVENDSSNNHDDDEEDAALRTIYLKLPSNAQSGVYEMEVTAYNDDAEVSVRKLISVGSSASATVLAAQKNMDIKAGETVTYDMMIVNPSDDVKVFSIEAMSSDALKVSAPTAVAVGPKTSEKVSVMVTAPKDAKVGTYTFTVSVDGSQTVFSANVAASNMSVSLVAWTVVLVVVFIVLLAVLLVLVTRKEKPVEEVETSYY